MKKRIVELGKHCRSSYIKKKFYVQSVCFIYKYRLTWVRRLIPVEKDIE